jgi:mRNA-degrading endonuclease RelE of RelBE toxin-antitoxin system
MATVAFETAAAAELEQLSNPIHNRILRIIERLKDWPNVSEAKPLRGDLTGRFRLRTGDYRIQFRVVIDKVIVEKIGHRDRFYDD